MVSRLSQYRSYYLITLTLVGLYISSLYSYLLFHSLAELFRSASSNLFSACTARVNIRAVVWDWPSAKRSSNAMEAASPPAASLGAAFIIALPAERNE